LPDETADCQTLVLAPAAAAAAADDDDDDAALSLLNVGFTLRCRPLAGAGLA